MSIAPGGGGVWAACLRLLLEDPDLEPRGSRGGQQPPRILSAIGISHLFECHPLGPAASYAMTSLEMSCLHFHVWSPTPTQFLPLAQCSPKAPVRVLPLVILLPDVLSVCSEVLRAERAQLRGKRREGHLEILALLAFLRPKASCCPSPLLVRVLGQRAAHPKPTLPFHYGEAVGISCLLGPLCTGKGLERVYNRMHG